MIVFCFLKHFVLAVKLLVAYAIPDIPHKVAEEKARLEFLRREALKVGLFGHSKLLPFGKYFISHLVVFISICFSVKAGVACSPNFTVC